MYCDMSRLDIPVYTKLIDTKSPILYRFFIFIINDDLQINQGG